MAAKLRSRTPVGPPRIDYIRVENYRALRKVELADLTPLTVLLGPNGSGKSTVFDVFNFLSECFTLGLRKAWDKRGRDLKQRLEDAAIHDRPAQDRGSPRDRRTHGSFSEHVTKLLRAARRSRRDVGMMGALQGR